jgi:hypothetical protein
MISETGEITISGRKVFFDPETLIKFSEVTRTIPYGEGFIVIPSIDENGAQLSDEELSKHVSEAGPVDPVTGADLPVFGDMDSANEYAQMRSERISQNLKEQRDTRELLQRREVRPPSPPLRPPMVEPILRAQGQSGDFEAGPEFSNKTGPFKSDRITAVQGQTGLRGNLPGNVTIEAGPEFSYAKRTRQFEPEFVDRMRSLGYNVPTEVTSGTRGLDFPIRRFAVRGPVFGGIGSLATRFNPQTKDYMFSLGYNRRF